MRSTQFGQMLDKDLDTLLQQGEAQIIDILVRRGGCIKVSHCG
jgi:hypothetical protein